MILTLTRITIVIIAGIGGNDGRMLARHEGGGGAEVGACGREKSNGLPSGAEDLSQG